MVNWSKAIVPLFAGLSGGLHLNGNGVHIARPDRRLSALDGDVDNTVEVEETLELLSLFKKKIKRID